jgi:hypothetical protein
MSATDPIVAIVGNLKTHLQAPAMAEAIGRELAKAGLRILVYSSGVDFLEGRIVSGYIGSNVAARRSVQVRYPLHGSKPAFPEQQTHGHVFDWRPEHGQDWEMSFYQSLNEVDGILLMGGGDSTMIAGLVAMGHGIAMLPVAGLGGKATAVWGVLRPGRDLATADEISLMARPASTDDDAPEYVKALKDQIARKTDRARQQRVEQLRQETSMTLNAAFALSMFLLAILSVAMAWGGTFWKAAWAAPVSIALLFVSPLLAGVSGATVRLVFDLREGAAPLTSQSAITTAALGLIAGGVAGLLFITAQLTTVTAPEGQIVSIDQARRLVAFAVLIGFVAGLTLDAVFRKLIATDVVETTVIETRKRS